MPLDVAKLKAHHRMLLQQLPVSVTFGGVVYTGTKTQVSLDKVYLDPGKLDQYSFSVFLSQYDLRRTTLPAVGQTVTIDSVTYRILARATDAADVSIRLDLGGQMA